MKVHFEHIYRKLNEDGEKEDAIKVLAIDTDDISCLYRDRNGVFITTFQGKIYKVNHKLKELRPYLNPDNLIPKEIF